MRTVLQVQPPTDERYSMVAMLIRAGGIGTLEKLFKLLPKTTMAKDMGINVNRLTNCLLNPYHFTLKDITSMAGLLGIDRRILMNMFMDHLEMREKEWKKYLDKEPAATRKTRSRSGSSPEG